MPFHTTGTHPCVEASHAAHITLHTLHCTYYTAHITLHILHCTHYTAHITLHILHCTHYTAHITLHILHCTHYTAHITLHTLHCTHYTAHITLHTLHCTHRHKCFPFVSSPHRKMFLWSSVELNWTELNWRTQPGGRIAQSAKCN